MRVIGRDEVFERSKQLPAFPAIVLKLLTTIDDSDANINTLVDHIKRDPLLAARVLAMSNAAVARRREIAKVDDVYTATSMVGINNVRKIALKCSISRFTNTDKKQMGFWRHSLGVAICAEEVAAHIGSELSAELVLLAGLLNDIGEYWLSFFYPEDYLRLVQQLGSDVAGDALQRERNIFGVDHATIGAWLAEYWKLPANICIAVRYHHKPDECAGDVMVQLTHVAEVIANALNLAEENSRVNYLSVRACNTLGLRWNEDVKEVFGRIEARTRHSSQIFEG